MLSVTCSSYMTEMNFQIPSRTELRIHLIPGAPVAGQRIQVRFLFPQTAEGREGRLTLASGAGAALHSRLCDVLHKILLKN